MARFNRLKFSVKLKDTLHLSFKHNCNTDGYLINCRKTLSLLSCNRVLLMNCKRSTVKCTYVKMYLCTVKFRPPYISEHILALYNIAKRNKLYIKQDLMIRACIQNKISTLKS